jgi:hypothetical protein
LATSSTTSFRLSPHLPFPAKAGQVNIHIIYLDSEATICEELKKKWRNHDALMERMTDLAKRTQTLKSKPYGTY